MVIIVRITLKYLYTKTDYKIPTSESEFKNKYCNYIHIKMNSKFPN